MFSNNVSFSNQEFVAARKRCKVGIMDDESDASVSSFESSGGSEAPLLPAFHRLSYATPVEILRRMALSLVPPLHPSRVLTKPTLDPVGPTLVITLLICLLTYASSKTAPFKYHALEAVVIIGLYVIISSSTVFFLGYVFTGGRYPVSFLQILILLGYSLVGHLLSLLISFALYSYKDPSTELGQVANARDVVLGAVMPRDDAAGISGLSNAGDYAGLSTGVHAAALGEDLDPMMAANSGRPSLNEGGDTAFLISLPLLAGPATLRVALVLLSPIQSPPGRMILGTILCLCHLLLLIVLHASFVHPTFRYGAKG
ncbi:uncharacterized protein [Hetaerina americana]|uniref:uncharacterized protein n=1 Tax=Hetaerina americana TaxID=62018 RepID=UPI003A7F603A